ncbi:MAG TPA: SurA N-terminal domain-containing protein, partial [Thermoanaerobaculia bacterium]|nr:SurA N-terminal domain-containing protein [Thermoanaerobaculia bacterium]
MKRTFVFVVAAAFVSSGCATLFDPAAAVVRGKKITVEEVEEALEAFKETLEYERQIAQGDPQEIQRSYEQTYLSELIKNAVIEPEAEERGIEVSEDEIDEVVQSVEDEYGGRYEEVLREQGLTVEELREIVANNIREDKLRQEVTQDVVPTEEELRAHYEDNLEAYTETRSQHILVQSRAVAGTVAAQLQEAPANEVDRLFRQLARRFSTDEANKNQGGDLGYQRPGSFVEEFEAAAADLEVGEVS